MNIAKLTDQAGSYMSVINGNTCFTYEQLQKFVGIVRAEALEEAEEIAKTIGGSFSVEFLAAIRGLK